MIRPTTVAWLGLGLLVVVGLFHVKFQVQALEDEMSRLNRQIAAEQQAIHVLKAEWSFVNQPQRLQTLSSRFLDLQPLRPNQIVNLDGVGRDTLDALPPLAAAPAPPIPSRPIVLTPPRPRDATAAAPGAPRATLATHTLAPGPIVLRPPERR